MFKENSPVAYRMSLIWICVMVPHYWIHIMDFWYEHIGGDIVV